MVIDRVFIEKAYIQAITEVIGTMAGVKLEAVSAILNQAAENLEEKSGIVVNIDSLVQGAADDEIIGRRDAEPLNRTNRITGAMLLPGAHNALLLMSVSKDSAAQITAFMTGLEVGQLSAEDITDGVTELVNLTAGRMRASFYETEYDFKITAPFALVGSDYTLFQKSNVERIFVDFIGAGVVLTLEAYFLD
ncbi:MAG: chemotaxis protein CheX [Solirubrobacterales bacterium]